MPDYAVTITLAPIGPSAFTEAQAEALAAVGGSATLERDGWRLDTTLTVGAASPILAGGRALDEVAQLVAGDVIALEVLAAAEQDRRLGEAAFPELVGISEIAEILKVSRQRASTLQARHDFPAPVATLRSGPVWRRRDLDTFATTWERKPGRPRRVTSSGVRGITSDLARLKP